MLSKFKTPSLTAILICLILVLVFSVFSLKAWVGGKVQFTDNTIVSLTGINDGDLYIAQNSECDSLNISGSTLTINDIPDGASFILKTTSHNNALKITPSNGVLDLTFDSGNLSSGNITQWTLNASTGTTVAHIVGVSQANKWYAVKANNILLNNYQSNSSNEISFTYSGGFSSKVFTIEEGSAPGGGLPPLSQNPPSNPEPTPDNPNPAFSILINNNNEYTNNRTVTLKLNAGLDTKRMAISNTEDFKYASQIPYQSEIEWEIEVESQKSIKSKVKTVYVRFYTQYGVSSETVSGSIIYTDELNPVIFNGSLIRAVNDYKVYIINNNYKRHIIDGEIFNFYGHLNWDSIQEINPSQLSGYQESFLVRASNDYKVYKINDEKKHWLNMTEEEFIDSGRNWEMVYVVNEEELGWYEMGE